MTCTTYLPAVTGGAPEPDPRIDMLPFVSGDGRLYEMRHINPDTAAESQARHQTLWECYDKFGWYEWFHTKSPGDHRPAEWEQLFAGGDFVYRSMDTSPGNGRFYVLADDDQRNVKLSRWCPRFWAPGDVYPRNPFVYWYEKATCKYLPHESDYQPTWLRFAAYYMAAETAVGLIADVVMLEWLTQLAEDGRPEHIEETYWYARDFGLIRWGSDLHGYSEIVELHAPGARPDNVREIIPCWNGSTS